MNSHYRFLKTILLITLATTISYSCNDINTKKNENKYYSFQLEENGYWGLISIDGKILFEEEFPELITPAGNNRFFAMNQDHDWELYSAEKKPQKIGEDKYSDILPFVSGIDVTPVVCKNEPIKLIDNNGNVIKILDKLNGEEVRSVYQYMENGLTCYSVSGENNYMTGVINTKGEIIIPAIYENISICDDTNTIFANRENEWYIYNYNGDLISTSPFKNTDRLKYDVIKGGHIIMYDGNKYSLLDYNRHIKLRFNKGIEPIEIKSEYIVYRNTIDGRYGLMNMNNQNIIYPKYNKMTLIDNNLLSVQKLKNEEFYLIDYEENKLGRTFKEIRVSDYINGHIPAVEYENNIVIINKKGEIVSEIGKSFYSIYTREYIPIDSEYFDYKTFLDSLQISQYGIGKYNINMNVRECVMQTGDEDFIDEHCVIGLQDKIYIKLGKRKYPIGINVDFPDRTEYQNSKEKDEERKPNSISIHIPHGFFHDHRGRDYDDEALFNAIVNYIKPDIKNTNEYSENFYMFTMNNGYSFTIKKDKSGNMITITSPE